MKRINVYFIGIVLALAFSVSVNAQVKVESDGKVVLGTNGTSEEFSTRLVVNNSNARRNVTGIYASSAASGSYTDKAIAIHGVGGSTQPYATGKGFGVKGVAIRDGYGVVGLMNGSNGVGIYGGTGDTEAVISGLYAGYFQGNVRSTGIINGVTVGNSDVRYKRDITDLRPERSLKSILTLRPVEYYLEQQYVKVVSVDSLTKRESVTIHPVYDEKSKVFQNKHYGLIAQEVQRLYPDLVYELDDSGYLGINYMEIIPMLIQSIQELNSRIEVLESADKNIIIKRSTPLEAEVFGDGDSMLDTQIASLQQNAPNPFSQSTEIKYYLPETVSTAFLCIYDLQGKQLSQIPINERGEGGETISGSQFTPGIYLYALIADGKEVAVKRMILTE